MQKFDEYFQVRKNLVYERANFNLVYQLADKSAEQFITRLHQLAVNCEFGDLKNEMIRDRLIIGIHDGQLSERLQMESDLAKSREASPTKSSSVTAAKGTENSSGKQATTGSH